MEDCSESDARKHADACSERARAVANELGSHAVVTGLARAQLLDVNERTGKAALHVVERLQHIDDGIAAIVQAAGTSADRSELLVARSNVEVRDKLAGLGKLSDAFSQDLVLAGRLIRDALDERANLHAFTRQIADLGRELAALAARADAARKSDGDGDEAAFAGDAAHAAARCGEIAGDLGTEIARTQIIVHQAFSAYEHRCEARTRQVRSSLNAQCAALNARLTMMTDARNETIASIREHQREVASLVDDLLATLQLHDLTRQQVEHVAHTLAQVDQHNADLQQVLLTADLSTNVPEFAPTIDRLCETFVMQMGRAPHQTPALAGCDVDFAAPRVELF